MFNLFSKQLLVSKIKKGLLLQHAKEVSVREFMDQRLRNPPRKALVGICLVLFENEDYIYWGNPKFRALFSDVRVVEQIYKTSRNEVEANFPRYKEDFFLLELRSTINQAVHELLTTSQTEKPQYCYLLPNFKINITDSALELIAQCKIEYLCEGEDARHENKVFNVILDKSSLMLNAISPLEDQENGFFS